LERRTASATINGPQEGAAANAATAAAPAKFRRLSFQPDASRRIAYTSGVSLCAVGAPKSSATPLGPFGMIARHPPESDLRIS
jgi:hypothetical protein